MLTDDYVWDQTGEAEPDVLAWEQSLGALRHRAPLRRSVMPLLDESTPSKPGWAMPVVAGALLCSALTVLLIWGFVRLGPGAPTETVTEISRVAVSGPPPSKRHAPVQEATASPPPSEAMSEARLAKIEGALEAIASALAEIREAIKRLEVPSRKPTSTPPTPQRARDAPSIDDILGPSRKPTSTPSSPQRTPDPPSIDDILGPSRSERSRAAGQRSLTQTEIKAGIAPHKDEARRCIRHGGNAGDKIVVKLTIDGASGRVSRARATGVHASTPLGDCAARALRRARFPKFDKRRLGVAYPIRLQ